MTDENLKIIYNEVIDARKQQQEDVNLIYNKFNWIIISDIALIIVILNSKPLSSLLIFVFLILTTSLIFSLLSLRLNSFKRGPKLEKLVYYRNKSSKYFLNALNNKIIKDIEYNKKNIKWFGNYLKISIFLLIIGVIFLLISFSIPFINNLSINICQSIIQ